MVPTEESLLNPTGNFDVNGISRSDSAAGDSGTRIVYLWENLTILKRIKKTVSPQVKSGLVMIILLMSCQDTAQVRKVQTHPFKLHIAWVHPRLGYQGGTDWVNEDLPVVCGEFARDNSEDTADIDIFSHQVNYDNCISRHTFIIYPREGEIWALFKDWDVRWRSNSEKHTKTRHGYEFVEVVVEHVETIGIRVVNLVKISGYVSLFERKMEANSVLILPNDLLRFSHRVPSYKMNGTERKGVPDGYFELDPACISLYP